MKITTVLKQNLSLPKLLMFCLCFLILINNINSDCKAIYGCLARQKFMSYVTVQGKDGDAFPLRSIMNYKIVYVFTDRIVFYTSSDAGSTALEPEENEDINKVEAKIERAIHYGEILLDCGKYHNKLCHAQEYPGIDKNESFKLVQKTVTSNADVFCLTIPFFENGYMKHHEKMAYICATNSKELYNIITFKNYLSRRIEHYQLKMSADRYNGFNGLIKKRNKFMIRQNNKTLNVNGKIFNGYITFTTNDEERKFISQYSLYQQRDHNNGAWIVNQGIEKKKVPDDWSTGFSPVPPADCCIYFKGELENLVMCIASDEGTSFETASDVCKNKMKGIYGEIVNSLRGIKFSEAYHELIHNKMKRADCKSNEYKTMKWRAEKTINYAIGVDCKFVMNYVSGDDYDKKYNFCYKNYGDELKLELKLMSLDNDDIYNSINDCVYKSKDFSKYFNEKTFKDLMKDEKIQKTSFMELEAKTDDDDDDLAEINASPKQNLRSSDEFSFAETNSKNSKPSKKKKKTTQEISYTQSKDNYSEADMNRIKIFMNTEMTELQKNKQWKTAPREVINEDFNIHAASLGKKNSDEFVSFLGFLRDASYRASKIVSKIEEQKLLEQAK
jgi:hypothetical protein